jgi:3-phenylpropionate/trans-cinnamate dioxygenase ferredoxin subunit
MGLYYQKVATLTDLKPGETKQISPRRGAHILLCNVAGIIYAVKDACTHDGGILGWGCLEGNIIECPRHGAQFDVITGDVVAPPAGTPLLTYAVRIVGQDIEVGLED